MSQVIQKILGRTDYHFTQALTQLEKATGQQGIDARLIGDMLSRAHRVMRAIGLDPADTTALELYKALAVNADHTQLFRDTDYAALIIDGEVISFNQIDIRANLERPFILRTFDAVRCALACELAERYLVSPSDRVSLLLQQSGLDRCIENCPGIRHHKSEQSAVDSTLLVVGDTGVSSVMHIDPTRTHEGDAILEPGSTVMYTDAPLVYGAGSAGTIARIAAQAGIATHLASWLGDDSAGKTTRATLTKAGVDTTLTRTVANADTQRYITLAYGAGTTTFIHASEAEYSWKPPKSAPSWIVVAAMHAESWHYVSEVVGYARDNQSRLIIYPGYEQLTWSRTRLRNLFAAAEFVVLSIDDARRMLRRSSADVAEIIVALRNYGITNIAVVDTTTGVVSVSMGRSIVEATYHDVAASFDHGRECCDAFVAEFVAAYTQSADVYQALDSATFNCGHTTKQVASHERVTIEERTYL